MKTMKIKKLKPVRASKLLERKYRKRIENHINEIIKLLLNQPEIQNFKPRKITDEPLIDRCFQKIIRNGSNSLLEDKEFKQLFKDIDFLELFKRIANFLSAIGDLYFLTVAELVGEMNEDNKKKYVKQLKKIFGINLESIVNEDEKIKEFIETAIQYNVSLIKSIESELLNKVEEAVYRNFLLGSKQSLIEEIQYIKNVSYKKARLIARDQTSKINSNLTMIRQIKLGITKYEWVDSDDERVRPKHKENNGKIFEWDKPPEETGHPGFDIQCRCIARGILPV